LGQLTKKLEENFEKTFTANTKVNPIDDCNVIIIKSENELEEREKKGWKKMKRVRKKKNGEKIREKWWENWGGI